VVTDFYLAVYPVSKLNQNDTAETLMGIFSFLALTLLKDSISILAKPKGW